MPPLSGQSHGPESAFPFPKVQTIEQGYELPPLPCTLGPPGCNGFRDANRLPRYGSHVFLRGLGFHRLSTDLDGPNTPGPGATRRTVPPEQGGDPSDGDGTHKRSLYQGHGLVPTAAELNFYVTTLKPGGPIVMVSLQYRRFLLA